MRHIMGRVRIGNSPVNIQNTSGGGAYAPPLVAWGICPTLLTSLTVGHITHPVNIANTLLTSLTGVGTVLATDSTRNQEEPIHIDPATLRGKFLLIWVYWLRAGING